ncbi:MAG TPA: RDD family protein [Acidimicrobiales bacterium]|nr:RDD family protein [Acidimicrobiales bacterium]
MTTAGAPAAISHDPTAVVGRRIAAWAIDLVMFAALEVLLVVSLGTRHHQGACDQLTRGHAAAQCLSLGSNTYLVAGGRLALGTAISVTWFLGLFSLLQGLTGRTPGKLLTGVRVVGPDGHAPGIRPAFVRSVCWVADGFPYLLGPVVGGVAMVSTAGHQRLGDRAAHTWVVATGAAGVPIGPAG